MESILSILSVESLEFVENELKYSLMRGKLDNSWKIKCFMNVYY